MGALVVIGNFDGVHRGHRALLEGAEREAGKKGLAPTLLTFFPHPATVLGRVPPPLLTTQARKRELVRAVAPQVRFHEETFDLAFAAQTPDAFARRLAEELGTKAVIVGQNFRFGKGRAGGFDDLVALGKTYGFEAHFEPLHGDAKGRWSSTRAREAIARGDLADAFETLGRPHMVSGRVVHGKKLGRTIGFPTCNLGAVPELLPPLGVYAARVDRVKEGVAHPLADGALSIGVNPTTDATNDVKVEVYLLDFDQDLYDAELRLHIVERIRGEEKFDGIDALKRQIAADVDDVRRVLNAAKRLERGVGAPPAPNEQS